MSEQQQDIAQMTDHTLSLCVRSARITGDRKAWRKFRAEQERRERADKPQD